MKLHILETVVILPSKPPFTADHVLPLSHIDADPNLNVTLRYLRIYGNNKQSDPFHVITAALSGALVPFYPFAGTLCHRESDGLLQLHCHVGGGVPVVSAMVDRELSSVDYLDAEADRELIEELATDPDPKEDVIRPMILQVTRFSCGGFILGAAIHHAICDGLGATLFFNAMAELARGETQSTIDPVWDRSTLLGPRAPPRLEFPIQEFLNLDKDFSPYSSSSGKKRVIKACFNVKEESLNHLKGFVLEHSGLKVTTFEALGAFIWRARTQACEVPGYEKVTFAYSINIRKVVNPPLPVGYWGNGCAPMYVNLTAKELLEQPIWKTADLIKKSKFNATDEYVRSFVDFQDIHYGQGITAGNRVSGFTDWRHLGHSSVDFGWGGPVAVVPLSRHLLGSNEPCYFLPGKKDEIRVFIHVEEDAMAEFRREMDRLSNMKNDLQAAL